MTPLDLRNECLKHMERAFEEAFRRFPDDPYRALTWLLFAESNMPRGRADFLLRQFQSLRKDSSYLTRSEEKPPGEAAPAQAVRTVLLVLLSPLALLSPSYNDALALADEHRITARQMLEYYKERMRLR